MELSDQQLRVILRKSEIGPVDRDNHEVITGQFAEMHEAPLRIGIEMYLGKGVPNAWYTITGIEIPPEDVDALQYKYRLPTLAEQKTLDNFWWVVRIRPSGSSRKYEYMPNSTYSWSVVHGFFARNKMTLSACRWFYDVPIERTAAACLYPYHQFCPGLELDFQVMNIALGIDEFQYMEESKTLIADQKAMTASLRTEVKREPHKTVQLLVEHHALPDSTAESLERYLKAVEYNLGEVGFAMAKAPFATARRFLTLQEHRLNAIKKAVQNVRKMPQQHGSFVNNLPQERDDDRNDQVMEEGNPPAETTEYSTIQYVQLPLPRQQVKGLNMDRQSGGRGGNNR
jgi:hypothetical protein